MNIDQNLLITAKIMHDEYESCKQTRIGWLRTLPGDELLDVAQEMHYRSDGWWKIAVSLKQFRVDVGLDEPAEKPRKKWFEMLSGTQKAFLLINGIGGKCGECGERESKCIKGFCSRSYLNGWWNEMVTIEQFNEDIKIK